MLEVLQLPFQTLTAIPGVGERLEARLVSFFGSRDEAMKAIAYCRLSLLEEAIGKPAATRLVYGVYRALYGKWPRDVAGSGEAWTLFQQARSILEEEAVTRLGRDILSCYLPAPASGVRDAEKRFEILALYRTVAETVGDIHNVLGKIGGQVEWPKPIRTAKLRRTLVVLGDREAYAKATSMLSSLVRVVYVDDPAQIDDIIGGEEDIVVYDPYGIYAGPHPVVENISIEAVAPETVVDYFRVNWRVLNAIARIVEELGIDTIVKIASIYGLEVGRSDVEELVWASKVFEKGDISDAVDEEYRRIRRALSRLESVVDDVESWVNEMLRNELERLEIRLPASRLLEVFASIQRGEQPLIELPEELYEVFTRAAEEAEKTIAERLELEPDEAELISGIAPRVPSYPVTFDRSRVGELRTLLASKLGKRRLEVMRRIASRVKGLKKTLENLTQLIAYIDAGAAYYKLRLHRLAAKPVLDTSSVGVAFRGALEAELAKAYIHRGAKVQRVTYVVGTVKVNWPNPTKGERLILLTGANSGGKTTLLKTVAEIVLASQAGLPVLAEEAIVTPFDKVFFLSKPGGEVGAGALEQLIKTLASITVKPGRKLILIDELEAATEAGAAAKIIAGFLQVLGDQSDSIAIVVTHLAEQVVEWLRRLGVKGVRVDGIEAKGLDENYNLVVDRNPRYYHLARSTPELVLRRLEARAREALEKRFYGRLLALLSTKT